MRPSIPEPARPRVLLFSPDLPPYRLDIFNALHRRCPLRVVLFHENLLAHKFDQVQLRAALRPECVQLGHGFTWRARTVRFGLGREIAAYAPDVVLTCEFSPATIAVAAHRGRRGPSFAHVAWTDDNPMSVANDAWPRRLLRKALLPRLDGLVVVSEEAARMYRERYRAKTHLAVVPILHDEAVFRSALAAAVPVAHALLDAHRLRGRPVLLFVGRLAPEKRLERLLEAFARLREGVPRAVLVLVGEGPERHGLERLSAALGIADRVLFAGWREGVELMAWYLLGSLFVLTSSLERFGAVVNEALLAGMPVVCSDRAGARSLIVEGRNGTVVDAGDPEALSAALRAWLSDARPSERALGATLRPSLMTASFRDAVDQYARLVDLVGEGAPRR